MDKAVDLLYIEKIDGFVKSSSMVLRGRTVKIDANLDALISGEKAPPSGMIFYDLTSCGGRK